jgi:micrococcal nuclease
VGTRTATSWLAIALGLSLPLPAAGQRQASSSSVCLVQRIADGDTFTCADGRRVRLIGIDSPESQQSPYGERARIALLELLPLGASVRLESDVVRTDRYGRVLAYVWACRILVNEAMVRDGWAVLYTVPPNVKYVDRLTRAQNEARTASAGLWSERGFDCLPSDFRRKRCVSSP